MTEIIEARSIDSLSLSPDGRRLGFRMISRSVSQDKVEAQWFVLPLDGSMVPVAVGKPTEPFFIPEFDLVQDGVSAWPEDDRALYVLAGGTDGHQIHRLGPEGQDEIATHDPADIISFSPTGAGSRITYTTRDDRAAIGAAQAREEAEGVRIDRTIFPEGLRLTRNFRDGERWATMRRAGPPLGADFAIDAFAGPIREKMADLALAPGQAAPVSDGRVDMLSTADPVDRQKTLRSADGSYTVRISAGPPDRLHSQQIVVRAQMADGRLQTCAAFFCRGNELALRNVMLNDHTGEVVIAHEADNSARTGLYGWDPRSNKIRTIVSPQGALDGGSPYSGAPCRQRGRLLFCVEARADSPPRLVSIDLGTGRTSIVFDPNAAIRTRFYGNPTYIAWKDRKGRPWNGILLSPAGWNVARPLVITTYRCRGFLRGSVSNLAPEYALLERGFAVLCANQNNEVAIETEASGERIPAAGVKATLEGYIAIIQLLAGQGKADPARVGIAGHSFSANAISYAISHSSLFGAAVMGAGTTLDPFSYNVTAPTSDSWRKQYLDILNMPPPTRDPKNLWAEVSPALNAHAIDTPLLIQPPENEWLFASQLFTAMQDAGKTVEMFVYPDEGHSVGRHPLHQFWRGQRSIEWFATWLQAPRKPQAGDPPEIQRWRTWRQRRDESAR